MPQLTAANIPGLLTGAMAPATQLPGGTYPRAGGGENGGMGSSELSGLLAASIAQSLSLRQRQAEEALSASQEQRKWARQDRRQAKAPQMSEAPRQQAPVDPYRIKRRALFEAQNDLSNFNPPGADVGVRGVGREPAGMAGMRGAANLVGAAGLTAEDVQAALLMRR
jgi:hypothetical protein